MHGIVLKRLGHHVHILDRNPTDRLESQGAGIRTGEYVGEFLKKYDRIAAQPLATRSKAIHFLNREGKPTGVRNWPLMSTSWSALYYRLRANYDGKRTEYCPNPPEALETDGEGIYDAGKIVTDVKRGGSGSQLTVIFEDATGTSSVPADLVIGADGSSSTVRDIVQPEAKRRWAKYVAWRGTVPESEVSAAARDIFVDHITFFQRPGGSGHILLYPIPGVAGALEPGKRDLNWVWYNNYPSDSEIAEVLTDTDGKPHRITLPLGKMRPEVWARQQHIADEVLPPTFAELVCRTTRPFAQNISDVPVGRAAFWDGRVLLVGDALALFRPHAAASTNQAALNALLLDQTARGEITMEEWAARSVAYARVTEAFSEAWGSWNQFGVSLATARSVLYWAYVAVVQRLTGQAHKQFA